MALKRLAVCITAILLLIPGLAMASHSLKFSLTGGGGQLHIGNGLALPIQPAIANVPFAAPGQLLIPAAMTGMGGDYILSGTISKPLLTAMATPSGPVTKQGYQRRLSVPAGVLAKAAAQTTVGVKFSNPAVFAVGTNLAYAWPAAPAVFTAPAPGLAVVPMAGVGTMTYTNTLGARFGGAGAFALAPGVPVGPPTTLFPGAPVTVYLKINTVTPPCTFPAVPPGGCVAGIILAAPTGAGAIGAATTVTVMTPGVPIVGKNVVGLKMGAVPLGTILPPPPVLIATKGIPTNMATSQAGPWTTGKVVISAPAPMEKWTLSGMDMRTQHGGGTIQMVSGSLSTRPASGPNANRGWVELELRRLAPVPSMSLVGLATTVALMLLAFGYTMRRRIFA